MTEFLKRRRVFPAWGMLLGLLAQFAGSIANGEAVPAEIREDAGHYYLVRDGQPYYIRGVGGSARLEDAVKVGANSIRTWGEEVGDILDRAHALGLTVCVGLWIEHERHGFDYSDEKAIAVQVQRHKDFIGRYKDHPAVLMWGIGNEVEINYTNEAVWDVVESVARYAREVSPAHPVMTVTAHIKPSVVRAIRERAPSVQILGVNAYGGLGAISGLARDHWKGPYVIGEWGPNGQWEVDKTKWGAEIEDTSTHKAFLRAVRYGWIVGDRDRCLGSYAFQWGQKQEVTPTWYGYFTADGAATESVEMLSLSWTGKVPAGRAPRITTLRINGARPVDNVILSPGAEARAAFDILEGGGKLDQLRWVLRAESTDRRLGGDKEDEAPDFPLDYVQSANTGIQFTAPTEPGPYRLFLYAYGAGKRTVATANFPFLVE